MRKRRWWDGLNLSISVGACSLLFYNTPMTEQDSIITIQARGPSTREGLLPCGRTVGNCMTIYNATLRHCSDA